MKIATWNVNSIRVRLERLTAWLARHQPDVLCLQETKVEDAAFPTDAFTQIGYQVAAHGQKTYNGVALLARHPLEGVERGMGDGIDDPQARLIGATVQGVRVVSVYVPNGEAVGTEKFAYKLAWLARLKAWLAPRVAGGARLAVCGDYNVAPADIDVHDPAAWAGGVLCSAEERAALANVASIGLVDIVRRLHPTEPCFSWWDYRQLAFPKNRGLRIDHVLATTGLAESAVAGGTDREARKGPQPSDHAPVWVEFQSG